MFGLKSHFHSEQNQLQQGVLYWHDFNLSYTQQKNIKAERSLQPFYKQSLSWILVKYVTFVEDVVMLEEWKCNPSTSTANGLQGLKFMLLLEEEEALREEEVILFISPVAAHPTRQLFPLIGTVWHFGKYTYSLVVKIVCENYQT